MRILLLRRVCPRFNIPQCAQSLRASTNRERVHRGTQTDLRNDGGSSARRCRLQGPDGARIDLFNSVEHDDYDEKRDIKIDDGYGLNDQPVIDRQFGYGHRQQQRHGRRNRIDHHEFRYHYVHHHQQIALRMRREPAARQSVIGSYFQPCARCSGTALKRTLATATKSVARVQPDRPASPDAR